MALCATPQTRRLSGGTFYCHLRNIWPQPLFSCFALGCAVFAWTEMGSMSQRGNVVAANSSHCDGQLAWSAIHLSLPVPIKCDCNRRAQHRKHYRTYCMYDSPEAERPERTSSDGQCDRLVVSRQHILESLLDFGSKKLVLCQPRSWSKR